MRMDEKMKRMEEITPYRMAQLTEAASKITKAMVTGVWHLTFEEMEIVLGMVQYGIEQSKGGEQCF